MLVPTIPFLTSDVFDQARNLHSYELNLGDKEGDKTLVLIKEKRTLFICIKPNSPIRILSLSETDTQKSKADPSEYVDAFFLHRR